MDHDGLSEGDAKHGKGNGRTLDDGLRLLPLVVVGTHKGNQVPEELGLSERREVIADFEDGCKHVRAAVGTEDGEPERGAVASLELVLPGVVKRRARGLGCVFLGQRPQIILGKICRVSVLHQGRHPREGEQREDGGVFDRALAILDENLVCVILLGPQPLEEELDDRETKADAVRDKVWLVGRIQLLGDERPELDGQGYQEQEPVEQDDPVGVSEARMLEPLYREDDEKGQDGGGRGPDAEIEEPNVPVVADLYPELDGNIGNDEDQQCLFWRISMDLPTSPTQQPTCFVQKCQSLAMAEGCLLRTSHHTAMDPNKMPKAATAATQTSMKHGVKSYRIGLSGPHPSSLPHRGCFRWRVAER